jgi:acetyltransferase
MTSTRPTDAGATSREHVPDALGVLRRPLDHIFTPQSVAVVGATEKAGSVGRTVLWNLISSPFGGTVFPVNPKRSNILGLKAYPSLSDVPDPVELAVIVTPSPSIPGLMDECVATGVKGAIIISAGFKETGPEGAELERQVLERARKGGIRVVGPNCLGVMNPIGGLNATFAAGMARPGTVGLLSQSGALLTAILDWSLEAEVGFSSVVSLGSMLDVGWGDAIYHLGDDPKTESIVCYMESVGDARAFLSAAREVALTKPIIVIKPGRTAQAAKAAASHTGSLTGSDDILDAAFRRVGVLRVDSIQDMFGMAEVLAKQPRPRGRKLTIVTNAGGPGVLATDALITGGGQLTEITGVSKEAFDAVLPAVWSHNNPVDIIGDAPPERYAAALEIAGKDASSDGMLVILTPQAMTDPTKTAEMLAPLAHTTGKPVLASWMGGRDVEEGANLLREAGIPTFPYPDTAAAMFNYLWRYDESLRALYETPALTDDPESQSTRIVASDIIEKARGEGRSLLTEFESKQVLSAYGIPITETRICCSADEAVAAAQAIGYPVVAKLHSETITHKTDVGGVQLNLTDAAAVRDAYKTIERNVLEKKGPGHFDGVTIQPMINFSGYELIIGSSIDPQFGPVLLFGMGGQLVELFKDRALALPPLTTTLARRMIEQTRIYGAFKGVRGRAPIDQAAVEQLLVRFGQLVAEQPWIKEIDINPLLASPERLIALDARVVLHDPPVKESDLPRLAIRPYPRQYAGTWKAATGVDFDIRPIRPEDEPLIVGFHHSLSDRTVQGRYLADLGLDKRIAHERLVRVCFNDYDREIALVALRRGDKGKDEIVAVARLSKRHAENGGEFAIVVSDCCQRIGLGTELLGRLIRVARDEGLDWIGANVQPDNTGALRAGARAGFTVSPIPGSNVLRAECKLRD